MLDSQLRDCSVSRTQNMSSVYGGDFKRGYGVYSPSLTKVWRSKGDACTFITEAVRCTSKPPHSCLSLSLRLYRALFHAWATLV
jgi:hypothetical protein